MVKRFCIAGVLALSILAIILCVRVMSEDSEVKVLEKGSETKAFIVGNYECPVSEDEIDAATAINVEYKGKVYQLCCPACVTHFRKFPDKFSFKASKAINEKNR